MDLPHRRISGLQCGHARNRNGVTWRDTPYHINKTVVTRFDIDNASLDLAGRFSNKRKASKAIMNYRRLWQYRPRLTRSNDDGGSSEHSIPQFQFLGPLDR
jgi:hypothetical protein